MNLYHFPAGAELDRLIHLKLFRPKEKEPSPPYSIREDEVSTIAKRLEEVYERKIVTGTLRVRPRKYFARYESGPSTATEVVAETLPLAVCRLAVILMDKYGPPEAG